ncbi:MAG: type II secretion system F family protein [Acidimicrobiales bacterium]
MRPALPWLCAIAVLIAIGPGRGAGKANVSRARRAPRSSRSTARWAAPIAAALLAAALSPPLAPVGAAAILGRRRWRRRADQRRRQSEVVAELPEVIDLLVLAVGAGCNVRFALEAVAPRAPPRFAAVLGLTLERTNRGERLADALVAAAVSLGEPARGLVAAVVASERYGAALLPALERQAAEARAERRRRAEEAARRLPVALLFPLVLCVLPAFGLLTLVPLVAGALGSLGR